MPDFSHALDLLKKGRLVKRLRWQGSPAHIRLVDPIDEPGTDGPEDRFRVVFPGRRALAVSDYFDTEAEAKKAMTAFKKEQRDAWKAYDKAEEALSPSLDVETKKTALAPSKPRYARGTEDEVVVEKSHAPRARRLNIPYLVAKGAAGENSPYIPQTPDLLANDWTEA